MSRRLVIIILVILIVGVAGGTAVLVISRLRGGGETPTADQTGGNLQESATGEQEVTDPTGDDDGDGLINADEQIWGTDRNNRDTDGDGFTDGEEVAAGYNPTIPSPNDKLPEGFQPGRDISPLDTAPNEPVAVDQFFVSGLDLSGPKGNVSEEFKKAVPEDQRTVEALNTFVRSQPIITQLPAPRDDVIQVQESASLSTYLDTAGNTTPFSNVPLFQSALVDLFENGDPSSIQGAALVIRSHQENLLTLSVPPAAVNLHKLLLAYSELLASTFDQMAQYNGDRVRAALAVRQWEEIDKKYMPIIEQEIARLGAQAN